MFGWIVGGLVVLGLIALCIYLSIRWGRGAHGGSFQDPMNEIQNTTPLKGPPMF